MTWKCNVCGHESPDGYGECENCMQLEIERLTTEVSDLQKAYGKRHKQINQIFTHADNAIRALRISDIDEAEAQINAIYETDND